MKGAKTRTNRKIEERKSVKDASKLKILKTIVKTTQNDSKKTKND